MGIRDIKKHKEENPYGPQNFEQQAQALTPVYLHGHQDHPLEMQRFK